MARTLFSGVDIDRVQGTSGTPLLSASGAIARVYLDVPGTQLADIQNADGSANATATLTVTSRSELPDFLGPVSGVTVLYVRVDGGDPLKVEAAPDVAPQIAVAIATQAEADRGTYLDKVTGTAQTVAGPVDFAVAPTVAGAAISAGGGTSKYEPSGQTYNVTESSFRKWRAAVARQRTGAFARINCYGDSITEDTPSRAGAWPEVFRPMLGVSLGATGTGTGPILLTPNSVGGDTRIAYTGSWANSPHGAFGTAREATGPGSTITFTPGIPNDRFLVTYRKGSSWGTFTYSVDGAAAVSVNANAGTDSIALLEIGPLTLGSHTLVINSPATAGQIVDISTLEASVGTGGIRVGKLAKSGTDAAAFTQSQGVAGSFDPFVPDLSVIFLGANDYNAQTPVATYKTRIGSAVTRARLTGDVLLVVTVPENYSTSGKTILRQAYTDALYQIADEQDVALLDLTKRWGTFTLGTAQGLYLDALTHPSVAGAFDIANAVFAAVRKGTEGPTAAIAGRRANRALDVTPTYSDGVAIVNVTVPVGTAGATPVVAVTKASDGSNVFSVDNNAIMRTSEARFTGRVGLGTNGGSAYVRSAATDKVRVEDSGTTARVDLGTDVELLTAAARYYVKSPDGTRYYLSPPNGGGAATWVAG